MNERVSAVTALPDRLARLAGAAASRARGLADLPQTAIDLGSAGKPG